MLRELDSRTRILVSGVLMSLVGAVTVLPAVLALSGGKEITLSVLSDRFRPMSWPVTFNFSFGSISGTDAYFAGLQRGDTVYVAIKLEGDVERPLSVTRERDKADAAADFVIRGTIDGFTPKEDTDPQYGFLELSLGIEETTLGGLPRVPSDHDESRGRQWKYIIAVLPSGYAVLKAISLNGKIIWRNTPW